jgi:hypothetical protein
MSDEQTTPPIPFRTNPSAPEIYANYVHLSWTLFDVRVRLGQIIPTANAPSEPKEFVAQEVGAVTMSWGQAKFLRDSLVDAIARYETANGLLVTPKLAQSE